MSDKEIIQNLFKEIQLMREEFMNELTSIKSMVSNNKKPMTVTDYATKYNKNPETVRRLLRKGMIEYKLIDKTKHPIG